MPLLLTAELIARLKLAVACLTAVLLFVEAARPYIVSARAKRAIAIALAAVSLGCYVDFFQHRTTHAYHRWEMFHYFLGAKYPRELSYERLYACAAVADAETGNEVAVRARMMRDLRDDSLITAASAVEHPEECKRYFTKERWDDFKRDVVWFRRAAGGGSWWEAMQRDHGFNASPVWSVAGHLLASLGPASHALCTWLSAVDVLLVVSSIAVVAWGFGWRIAFVAVVFWGTQAPAAYYWTGGSLLRQDWLFLILASAACMRKGRYGLAGAALAYSSLLRVFPVLFWTGPIVVGLAHAVRRRALPRWLVRFVAGGAVVAALLLPAGALVAGSGSYGEFWRHITMHAASPIANHMSLRTLFSVDFDVASRLRPDHPPGAASVRAANSTAASPAAPAARRWDEVRQERYQRLRPLYFASGAALLGLFLYAVARLRTPFLALGLSVMPIIVLTDPSCYYYTFWVVPVVLARVRRSTEMVLLGLAGLGQALLLLFPGADARYSALAALYLASALLFVVVFSRPLGRRAVRG